MAARATAGPPTHRHRAPTAATAPAALRTDGAADLAERAGLPGDHAEGLRRDVGAGQTAEERAAVADLDRLQQPERDLEQDEEQGDRGDQRAERGQRRAEQIHAAGQERTYRGDQHQGLSDLDRQRRGDRLPPPASQRVGVWQRVEHQEQGARDDQDEGDDDPDHVDDQQAQADHDEHQADQDDEQSAGLDAGDGVLEGVAQ
ncbi:hypothetical protein ACFSVJ_21000 [Prauserella oleivorans]